MSKNLLIFSAELIGTFGLLVAATGSIVYAERMSQEHGFHLGILFVSAMHFVGLFILVFFFGKYSMAHFNPAVTIGFYVAGYIKNKIITLYFAAQFAGAVLGTLFVKYAIGDFAKLGINEPNSSDYTVYSFFGVEVLASLFLMGAILLAINISKNEKISKLIVSFSVGAVIALDVYFFGNISGASMNPARSFSPAVITNTLDHLWLYFSAPFVGTTLCAIVYKLLYVQKTKAKPKRKGS